VPQAPLATLTVPKVPLATSPTVAETPFAGQARSAWPAKRAKPVPRTARSGQGRIRADQDTAAALATRIVRWDCQMISTIITALPAYGTIETGCVSTYTAAL